MSSIKLFLIGILDWLLESYGCQKFWNFNQIAYEESDAIRMSNKKMTTYEQNFKAVIVNFRFQINNNNVKFDLLLKSQF